MHFLSDKSSDILVLHQLPLFSHLFYANGTWALPGCPLLHGDHADESELKGQLHEKEEVEGRP